MPNTIDAFPFDETFEREYDVDVLRDMPSSPSIPRYGAGGGPIMRVTPHGGRPFIVTVPGTLERTRLATWPHPRRFAFFDGSSCPVVIDVDAPADPVTLTDGYGHGLAGVVTFRRHGIVVIATCCTLVAYDRDGLAWNASGLFCVTTRYSTKRTMCWSSWARAMRRDPGGTSSMRAPARSCPNRLDISLDRGLDEQQRGGAEPVERCVRSIRPRRRGTAAAPPEDDLQRVAPRR